MNKLNGAGNANATARIAAGDVDKNSSWSFSGDDGNKLLGANGDDWANYSKWHLAIDNAQKPDVKAHYKYPFGKNGKVYRSGIIAAESRAAAQGDTAIAAAAKRHLDKIDGKQVKPEANKTDEDRARESVRLGEKSMGEQRAYALLNIKTITEDGELRELEGTSSTPATDRMGDIVEPMGAVFEVPFPFLYQHDTKQPIGWVTFAKPTPNGIPYKVQLAGPGIAPFIDQAWALIKAKLVRAVSIGFRALDWKWIDEADWSNMGIHFLQWEWLELSAVTIPANMQADIATIKSCDRSLLSAPAETAGVKSVRLKPLPGASGSFVTQLSKGNGNMNVAEQLAGYEAKRQANVARMSALMKIANDDGARTFDQAESEEYDTLTTENGAIDKHIVRLKAHEVMLKETAQVIDPSKHGGGGATVENNDGGIRVPHGESVLRPNKNLPKGIPFVRYAMCLAKAKGNIMLAAQFADDYKDSTPEVGAAFRAGFQTKAAVAAGTTTDATWAGPLVQLQPMASEFIEFLRPMTLLGRMTNFRNVPFNISVPRQTAGSSSKWVGQATAKPVSKQGYDLVTLRFAKISTIVVLSEELVRFSNPSGELLARTDMANAIAEYMDEQAFDPDVAAVANVSPAAMTNGATKVNATGTTIASVDTDVGNVFAQFTTNNVSLLGAYWLMNPRTAQAIGMLRTVNGPLAYPTISAQGGTFWGFPVLTSNNIPISSVSANETFAVFINPSEILLADDGAMTLDMSSEASIEMDSAPAGGATSLVSMFQNNLIALRAERYINWLPRRSHAVVLWDGLRL